MPPRKADSCLFTLGLSSFTYGWAVGEKRYTAMQLLNKADAFQLKLLQFGDNLPLHLLTEKELDELFEASQEKGIALETGTRGFTEDNIRRYAKISHRLGAKFLRIIIDDAGYEPDADTVVSVFRKVEPELSKRSVRLGIENHDRFSSASLQKIIKDANSPWLGICLDTVNSFGAGEGLPTILQNLLPHTINVHMKDFIIRRLPHKQGFIIEGCPAGQGMTPMKHILEQVSLCETDIHIIFEQWVPPEAEMEETIGKEAAWAGQGIAYLKEMLYGS
jgi:3-oxoisoapionate decarboxylase